MLDVDFPYIVYTVEAQAGRRMNPLKWELRLASCVVEGEGESRGREKKALPCLPCHKRWRGIAESIQQARDYFLCAFLAFAFLFFPFLSLPPFPPV